MTSQNSAVKIVCLFLLVLSSFASSQKKQSEEIGFPILRLPQISPKPVIDGFINQDEWKGAAAVTGFVNYGFPPTPLPQFLQPVWYLAYDQEYVYLAHRYPVFPPGTLRARAKTKEKAEAQFFQDSILMDDHTEIQIVTVGRKNAIQSHFYKFATNPWDMVSDQKVQYSIGQMGQEYESRTVAQSRFQDTFWEQEIAIPLKDLNVSKIADGQTWVLQLVSAQDPGYNFYSWAYDAHWLHNDQHPEVILDSQAMAFQFLSLGDWMKGNPEFKFQAFNPGKVLRRLVIKVAITDPNGRLIFAEEKQVRVNPLEVKTEVISGKKLTLVPRATVSGITRDNLVSITVTEPETGKLYYQAKLPVIPEDSPVLQNYIKNLQAGRKPVAPDLSFAYMPSYHLLKAEADVGILGLDREISERAAYFRTSFGKEGGKLIGLNTGPFDQSGLASLTFRFPPLDEGNYWINLEILDYQGRPFLTKKDTFQRVFFPFENNKLGLNNRIIRPYQSLQTTDKGLLFTSGECELTEIGLPKQFTNRLVPTSQNILSGPVRLFLEQAGRRIEVKGQGISWTKKTPEKVELIASSQVGNMNFQVKGEAEYDGQYFITLTMEPHGRISMEKLTLEIPVNNPVDVIRPGTVSSSYFNNANPYSQVKNGLLWSNVLAGETPHIIFLGNGERGLYWYTESFQGWFLRYDKPFVEIEKQHARTVLRLSLVNDFFILSQKRSLSFAFLMVPVKPLPTDSRARQWDNERSHVGAGSWWGTIGAFVFPQKPEEWFYFVRGIPFEYQGRPVLAGFDTIPPAEAGSNGQRFWRKEKEYGAYRAADLIGYLQPEFKVFSGEWVDKTNPPIQPTSELLKRLDKQGQPIWPEPEQRSIYLKDCLTRSFIDFEVYYFYQMAKNTGVGGYWWDWHSYREGRSLLKGTAFLADDGSLRPKNSIFLVREMYKRIATICDELGIANTNNVYAPGPVYQVPWIERINSSEAMYLETAADDMFTAHGLDKYRALIGKYSGLPVTIVMNIPINLHDHRARSVIALSLLHDNGIFGIWKPEQPGTITRILKDFGYFSPETEWIPYWRSKSLVEMSKPEILTTVYRRKEGEKERYLSVLVNPQTTELTTNLALKVKTISPAKVTDLETGQPLFWKKGKNGLEIENIQVPSHEFRLVGISLGEL
ncbi:MAG: DUF6067 family protein [Candidatus Omnitrophica bacterium]|nr:DUF6067 family protein [Candidatus Omnitrophota bacterium]